MSAERSQRLLTVACLLSLVGLGLVTWSLFDPRPMPVIVAMSVGQVIGTLSFATFGFVVLKDLRAHYVARRSIPPSSR